MPYEASAKHLRVHRGPRAQVVIDDPRPANAEVLPVTNGRRRHRNERAACAAKELLRRVLTVRTKEIEDARNGHRRQFTNALNMAHLPLSRVAAWRLWQDDRRYRRASRRRRVRAEQAAGELRRLLRLLRGALQARGQPLQLVDHLPALR